MRTYIYVDGFNLYYGAVKGTPYKWLNIHDLCRRLLSNQNQILKIKYFTARISARSNDPDGPTRQNTYLRALGTLPDIEFFFGTFRAHNVRLPVAECLPYHVRLEQVVRTDEKGSDVNLATHLVNDAHKGEFDVGVLVTNDSDLLEAIRIVRHELNLTAGVINPHKKQSKELAQVASFTIPIRKQALASSQFPDTLTDSVGTFHKPASW